jgi:hypothetical protein
VNACHMGGKKDVLAYADAKIAGVGKDDLVVPLQGPFDKHGCELDQTTGTLVNVEIYRALWLVDATTC